MIEYSYTIDNIVASENNEKELDWYGYFTIYAKQQGITRSKQVQIGVLNYLELNQEQSEDQRRKLVNDWFKTSQYLERYKSELAKQLKKSITEIEKL